MGDLVDGEVTNSGVLETLEDVPHVAVVNVVVEHGDSLGSRLGGNHAS